MDGALRVGFIGLGLMGQGMAESLLKHNFPLTVMAHRNRAPIEALCKMGAKEAQTAAEIASLSDIVILCVSTTQQIESIVHGSEGLLAGAHQGLVIIDCSTSLPNSTLKMAETFEAAGCHLIDAPLARTPKEAREGRLNVMLGGDDEIVAHVRPVIEAFAENVFHVGDLGSAHKLKLINNFLSLGAAALVSEAATMAAKLDVDQRKLFEVCSLGGANSAMLGAVMPWVIAGDDSRLRFSLGNAGKDMGYLEETAQDSGISSKMLPALRELLKQAEKELGGDKYVPALFDVSAKLNGVDSQALRRT